MMTLIEHPLSPYAQKNKIALREKGIPFDLNTPQDIGSGATAQEFLTANPRAEVPVLIDGETVIFDSTIILEYVEDKWPEPALLPKTPADRARVRMIEEVMDTHFEAINWGLGEVDFFKRAEGTKAQEIHARAAQQTQDFFSWLEKQLSERDWFNGSQFGWGDLSVIPFVNGAAGFGNVPQQESRLADWTRRANARPSVALTAQEALDSVASMALVADVLEQGLFKREYRDHRLEWMIKTAGLEVIEQGLSKDNIRFSNDFS